MYSSGSDMSEYVVTEQSFARAAIVHTPLMMEDSLMNRATRFLKKHLLCYAIQATQVFHGCHGYIFCWC